MTGNTIHVDNREDSSLLRDTWYYQVLHDADMLLPIADTSWPHLWSPTACMPRCQQNSRGRKSSFSSKHNNPLQNNTKFNSKNEVFSSKILIIVYYLFMNRFKLFISANTSERSAGMWVWCFGLVSSPAKCLTTKYRCPFQTKLWEYSKM